MPRFCFPISSCRSSRWGSVSISFAARDRPSRTRCGPRGALRHVLDAIRQVQSELAGRVPLIGFAGAPFTLASYAIEGGHSSNFARTKALMYGAPAAWHRFCELLADVVADYLIAQIEAGVNAVQLFDT